MAGIEIGLMLFQGIVFLAILVILLYLIVQRIEERGKETFEKRNN